MITKNHLQSLLLLLLLLGCGSAWAQAEIHFEYDASGNRVKRFIVLPEPDARIATEEDQLADSLQTGELGDLVDLVYPNPTEGLLRFTLQGAENPISQVSIFDLNGRMIYKKTFLVPDFEVDITSQRLGVYLLRWAFLDQSRTIKIIKQ